MNRTSRVSTIRDHNIDPNTDHLYDPLRSVLNQRGSHVAPGVANTSLVSHDVKYLTDQQINDFERNTFIPIDAKLVPTNHLEKVRGEKFVVVNSSERVVGGPISEAQMQRIRAQGLKKEEILYEFGDYGVQQQQFQVQQQQFQVQQQVQQVQVQQQPPKLSSPPPQSKIIKTEVKEVIKQVDPPTKYRSPMVDEQTYKKADYKYNLFSAIDEPANNCRQFGGCTGCPGNQVIASRNKPQSINWLT